MSSTSHELRRASLTFLMSIFWATDYAFAQMVLKCADIGHLAAAPETHKRWAYQLEEEFFRQACCSVMPAYAASHDFCMHDRNSKSGLQQIATACCFHEFLGAQHCSSHMVYTGSRAVASRKALLFKLATYHYCTCDLPFAHCLQMTLVYTASETDLLQGGCSI